METTDLRWRRWAASLLPRLTGPIFDKEMRVSSRRRRNYVLRFLYIGLFTFLVASVWLNSIVHSTTSVYQASRMASAGQAIVTAILWFQFVAAQVIAVVMLSTSISDEIYKRTLGVLMTTPIGSFQIVIGKLTSRLLQIVLLLAISLPLLAVVRVFGGVPWGYLLCGLCVTLTAVVFVGALSLFFSIFTRRAYTAIIESILVTGFLFGVMPAMMLASLASFKSSFKVPINRVLGALLYVNPYMLMETAAEALYTARPTVSGVWPWHCAVMLGLSSLLLLLAMIFVRKAALRQAVGPAPSLQRSAACKAVWRCLQSGACKDRRCCGRSAGPPCSAGESSPDRGDRFRRGDSGPAALDVRTVRQSEDTQGPGDPGHVRRRLLQRRHPLHRRPAGHLHHHGEGVPDVAAPADDDRRQLGDSLGQVRGRGAPVPAGVGIAVWPYPRVYGAENHSSDRAWSTWRSWRPG